MNTRFRLRRGRLAGLLVLMLLPGRLHAQRQPSTALAVATCPDTAAPHLVDGPAPAAWAEQMLGTISLKRKVGQLVMPWIRGGQPNRRGREWRRVRNLVAEHAVGGFIVGAGPALATAAWLNELQELSDLPLLIGADLEWGVGARLPEATSLPVNMALAAAGDPYFAFLAGRITGEEARAAGIQLAFAPVADVNLNPSNPVINTRSYGADATAVAERVRAFVQGASDGGILTVAKHFPGHGDTDVDSHLGLPRIRATRTRLDSVELVPFRAAISAGVSGIMTAHITAAALSHGSGLPASLDPAVVTGVLRGELGFGGLVVTDALTMAAVSRGRTSGQLAVAAIEAGADILLQMSNPAGAIDSLVAAVERGEISVERIDASVRRVLEAKARAGLDRRRTISICRLTRTLANDEHRRWAASIADHSVTLLRDRFPGILPVRLPVGSADSVLVVLYDDGARRALGADFLAGLADRSVPTRAIRLSRRSSDEDLAEVDSMAAGAPLVVFGSFTRALPGKGGLGLPARIAALADRLADRGAVLVSFGDPYVVEQVPHARDYLIAWSDQAVAQRAALRALAGESPIQGALPISIPPRFAMGEGVIVPLPGSADEWVVAAAAAVRIPGI